MAWAAQVRRLVRGLLARPLFTAAAVLTLGLGIGANTAIFSVVYGVLLKPLPFHEPDRLVGVWHEAPGLGMPVVPQGPATYFTYRESGRAFEDIGLWREQTVSITGRGEPEQVPVLMVTDGILPVLRVQPLLGRVFGPDDDAPGAPPRAVLTYAFWQRKLGGEPGVLGSQLVVDGQSSEIIGVLPPSFRFLRANPALLLPLQLDRGEAFVGNFSFHGLARLRPGVGVEQANADVARMIPLVVESFPFLPGFSKAMFEEIRLGPNVQPLADEVLGDVGRVLWILLGTVAFVLLIACANVANLFLVRAEGRQQELAIRTAIGASRARIARELLGESVALALAGGALGLALASGCIRLLVVMAPAGLPRLEEIAIHPAVLLFTLAISLLAGLLFGLIPVLRYGTPNTAALKDGGRSASDGPGRHRARNLLVVSEIALAVVLLVVSGLMIRTFVAMRAVDPGFVRPAEVQTFRIAVPETLVADPEQAVRLHEQVARRLEQVPGVGAVGLASSITMDGRQTWDPVFVEEFPGPGGQMPPMRRYKWISPEYFEAMGQRVVAGRSFTWTEMFSYAPVVVVSENLAREYWKEPSAALGKRIRSTPENPWREIVGVVADVRDDGVAKSPPVVVYWPMLLGSFWMEEVFAMRTMGYAVRSDRTGSPTFLRELQQAVWSVNPQLPLAGVMTLEAVAAESMAQTSFALVMLGIAAAVALLLGVVGIYGVVAYTAAQRTREIGVRLALGAQAADVKRLFLRQGLVLAAAGIVLGLVAATALTRVMSALLFGVAPVDPMTYGLVAAVLGSVALLASYLPGRGAARLDPVQALRVDR
jgi:putative ABC transport system permease protein